MLKAAGHDFRAVNIGGDFPVSYVMQAEWDEILGRIRNGFLAAKSGDPSKIYLWGKRPWRLHPRPRRHAGQELGRRIVHRAISQGGDA